MLANVVLFQKKMFVCGICDEEYEKPNKCNHCRNTLVQCAGCTPLTSFGSINFIHLCKECIELNTKNKIESCEMCECVNVHKLIKCERCRCFLGLCSYCFDNDDYDICGCIYDRQLCDGCLNNIKTKCQKCDKDICTDCGFALFENNDWYYHCDDCYFK